jgi:hypothetical protein
VGVQGRGGRVEARVGGQVGVEQVAQTVRERAVAHHRGRWLGAGQVRGETVGDEGQALPHRGLRIPVFTADLFATGDDAANRAAEAAVDKVLKGARMHP